MRYPLHFLALFASLLSASASGQWTSNLNINTTVRAAASDQNQAKVVPTPNGGVWISWLDGIGSGWDVRAQLLDAQGLPAFPAGGVLVADRSLSSTQDYGLDVDTAGDALLSYRGSNGNQVFAAKVDSNGNLPWGPNGVLLSNNAGFSPQVTRTLDGGAVAAWGETSGVFTAKIDPLGNVLWTTLSSAPSGAFFVANVQESGLGAIVSIVHATGGFSAPRHLRAQRFDGAGNPLWGATPPAVFDGGSLQIGNFPDFLPDGADGAVFYWYSSSPSLQCFSQRIDASGNELWPHNGLPVSLNQAAPRTAPDGVFDAAAGDTFVFWRELSPNQGQSGVFGQRFDPSGNRLWGPNGAQVAAVDASTSSNVRAVLGQVPASAWAFWVESPSFGMDSLRGARVHASGSLDVGPIFPSTVPSGKARLTATRNAGGMAILAWSDSRTDGGDILAQNINPNGTLGNPLGFPVCSPAVANSSGAPAVISATGQSMVNGNEFVLTLTQAPDAQAAFFLASQTSGFVTMPGGSQGNLCLGGTIARFNSQVGFTAFGRFSIQVDLLNIPITPSAPVMAGETWHFQCWFRDFNPGVTSNFSNAVAVTFN